MNEKRVNEKATVCVCGHGPETHHYSSTAKPVRGDCHARLGDAVTECDCQAFTRRPWPDEKRVNEKDENGSAQGEWIGSWEVILRWWVHARRRYTEGSNVTLYQHRLFIGPRAEQRAERWVSDAD